MCNDAYSGVHIMFELCCLLHGVYWPTALYSFSDYNRNHCSAPIAPRSACCVHSCVPTQHSHLYNCLCHGVSIHIYRHARSFCRLQTCTYDKSRSDSMMHRLSENKYSATRWASCFQTCSQFAVLLGPLESQITRWQLSAWGLIEAQSCKLSSLHMCYLVFPYSLKYAWPLPQ